MKNIICTIILSTALSIYTTHAQTTHEVEGKTITDELQVKTGAAADHVLTSDAAGNATWQAPSGSSKIIDADGDTQIQVEESTDEDLIRMDISGQEVLKISQNGSGNILIEPQDILNNSFFGRLAGYSNVDGNSNSFFGLEAGYNNTDGSLNSFFGIAAGYNNTTGESNSFFGRLAGFSNVDGNSNSFFGRDAGYNNTSGYSNSFFGLQAGYSNIDGSLNSFFGRDAGYNNTSGYSNSFFGLQAGLSNTTGNSNSFFGLQAGYSNIDGSLNSFFGYQAGYSNTDGSLNSFFGIAAGYNNTTGVSNSFFGRLAGYSNTTGFDNTYVGRSAGSSANNSRSTIIGRSANTALSSDRDRAIAIGYNALVGCDNCAVIGGTGVDAVNVGIGTPEPMTKLHIEGGVDASLNAHGYLINGPIDGTNLVIDNNEIMARDSGNASSLYLNANGGNVGINLTTPPTEPLDVNGNAVFRGKVGIGGITGTNQLEVNGTASKSTAGDWLANSDRRLKKNIQNIASQDALDQMLALQGITYEWDDDKTGTDRPDGIQYGFTAQNIQEVFPELVTTDAQGYLQTAYGTYDAMTVEAMRALNDKIGKLEKENQELRTIIQTIAKNMDAIAAKAVITE